MTSLQGKGKRRTALVIFGLLIAITTASGIAEARGQGSAEESSRASGPIRYPVGCNLATLQGAFGTVGHGFVAAGPPPTPLAQFATITLLTMDGAGGLTNKTTRSIGGNITRDVSPGTYTVNEDCTGSMVVNTPGPPFQLTFDLVVGELQGVQATKFYFMATNPGRVVTATATRIR